MRIWAITILFVSTLALAAGKGNPPDIPVTQYLSDFDATNIPYTVQSDGAGAYYNVVDSVASVLMANTYNGLTWGDRLLDLRNSVSRTAAITFSPANAVQPGDPGYSAPANPPFWGTQLLAVRMENKCTFDNHDMLTMKPSDSFACIGLIRLPPSTKYAYYRLDMGSWDPTHFPESETQKMQVSCNAADSGGCNDWFLDPIPVVNPDGSTTPGKTRARLNLLDSTPHTGGTFNEGDFYLTYHFHVTRP